MDDDSEMMDLSGPDDGSAYRNEASMRRQQVQNHPATEGYNQYTSEGQYPSQQSLPRQQRQQQRSTSMQHVRSSSSPPTEQERRGSMSEMEQKERREAIKAILADKSIPEVERRKSIQALMDGRRSSIGSHSSYGSQSNYSHSNYSHSNYSHHNNSGTSHGSHRSGYSTSAGGTAVAPSPVPESALDAHIAGAAAEAAAGGQGQAGAHGFHPDDRTVHSAQAVLIGSREYGHPYAATTTLVPADAAQDPYLHQNTIEHSKRAELSRPACEHYKRNCTIISPCCGAAFGCRICHDDCPVLPPIIQPDEPMGMSNGMGVMDDDAMDDRRMYPRSSSMPVSLASFGEPQHHTIDRHAIREVICRRCYTRQSSQTNNCINCGIQFGEYHCAICNLWMTAEERPYHCAECGFCRVGGAENFRHCIDCGMCIDASLFAQHNCKVGKYMQNCPICQEDLFSSRSASHEMPCGHAIHWHCFRELAAHDSRCPVCKKTAETHERMQPTWNAMAMGIELQPVPPDLAKAVTIICNDCERTDENRAWHFLGVQCRNCTSFNTVVERITMVGPDAHAFLSVADPHPSQRQAAEEAAQQRGQRHQQQQATATVQDTEVPSEEQERLFREQQQYQARYMETRRAEQQQQAEQMRNEHDQQSRGDRRRIRDGFNGRRRSMGL